MRNIISHQYANIDYTLVVDAINNDLGQIRETCEQIVADLKANKI